MSTILKTENIFKTYHTSSGDVPVLKGINLDLEENKFYAIIGKSGSGKSTLMHILSGLDKASSGKVFLNDKDISTFNDNQMSEFRRRYIGFVYQQFNLIDEYNVEDNIMMPLKLDNKHVDKEFLNEIVEMLGIETKLKKYPYELSGGEKQRVAIARAIIAKPKIIFADEPTGNLDSVTGEKTVSLLIDCAKKYGSTLIVVTHDLDIAKLADQIINIEDGII